MISLLLRLQEFFFSSKIARRLVDGEGKDAVKSSGKHGGQTIEWLAKNDFAHLEWLVNKAYAKAILAVLEAEKP